MPVSSEITSALGGFASTQQALAASFAPVKKPDRVRRAIDIAKAGPDTALMRFGTDLEIDAIRTDVIAGLDAAIRETTGAIHGLGITERFGAEIEAVLGKPGQPNVASALSDLAEAFASLTDDEDRPAVLAAATALTGRFKDLCKTIARLRSDADRQLAEAVTKADALLRKIAALNSKIALAATSVGVPQTLADERTGLFADLARFLDFQFYGRGDGTLTLVTAAGTPLVNDAKPKLSFAPAQAPILPAMSLAGGELGSVFANGRDISGEIREGMLYALLTLRDATLPNLQSQIDTLAQTMQARMNQVSNRSLGGPGARGNYRGSRVFSRETSPSIALAGGEVVLALIGDDERCLSEIGLSSLIGQYLADTGLPPQTPWPVEVIATALDEWVAKTLRIKDGVPLISLDGEGRFSIELPPPLRLRLFDRRSINLSSGSFPSTDQPLGMTGPLGFSDTVGNLFKTPPSIAIKPSDTLGAIARKLDQVEGLSARVEPTETGFSLRISSRQGTDILPEPDLKGTRAAALLELLPSQDAAFEDVAVSCFGAPVGTVLTSRPLPGDGSALGLAGSVVLADDSGRQSEWVIDPGWNATAIVRAFSDQKGIPGLAPGLMTMGNRVAIKLSVPMPARITVVGDVLGLRSTPEQIVSGFANFLGLNDLFVADPADAFDAKSPTGVFATTATPGTAGALAFTQLLSSGGHPYDPAMMARISEIFSVPINIAAAGGLERSSESLCSYATRIVSNAFAQRGTVKSQLLYRKALLDGLIAQKSGLPAIDFDLEVRNLNGFRQALHDSSRVISSMGMLFESLAA